MTIERPYLFSGLVHSACLFSVACLGFGPAALAGEGLPPPEPHPLCLQEPAKKQVKDERINSRWPDGSVKSMTTYFEDDTYVEVHFHENGQKALESQHAVVLENGDPRHRRHVTQGTERRWHANGQLFVCAVYEESKKTGTWIYYQEDGRPASAFTYQDDREVQHLTYSRVFGWQPFH